MTRDPVAAHYTSGALLTRLRAALVNDGVDPEAPSAAELAPYDHFHGRGIEATRALFARLAVAAGDHVLDVGSGIGGPARLMASSHGCRVTGIDLTEEFCALARHLNGLLGIADRVRFEHESALQMSFGDDTFDGAYSMNVSMNIADRAGLYAEIYRVLKPGGWLALSEIARGPGGAVRYPSPWAASANSSFLLTPDETAAALEVAGFTRLHLEDVSAESAAFRERDAARAAAGAKPEHRAIELVHGDLTPTIVANGAASMRDRATVSIVVRCLKP